MRGQHEASDISLTPMIDLVFFLLIFFMTASTLAKPGESRTQVLLPVSETAPEVKDGPRRLVVEVASDGSCSFEGERSLESALGVRLKAAAGGKSARVVVRAGEDVAFEHVRSVMRASAEAGLPDVLFAAVGGAL